MSLAPDLAIPKLAAAIDQLSAESRLVLCLRYHEELSLEEIASVLGISQSVAEALHAAAIGELGISAS